MPEINFEPLNMVGLSLDVPIFGSGQKLARVQQAKMEMFKAENSKDQLETALTLQAEQALTEYLMSIRQFTIDEEGFDLSKRIFTQTTRKYGLGLSSSFDLTNSQNQMLQNQQSYFSSMFNVLSKKLALDKAYGKL